MLSINLPKSINAGEWTTGHIQGIAVDTKRQFIYYSFTKVLVKSDLNGNIIGTVTGLTGHLGDLDFNDSDGRVYGSLEYKGEFNKDYEDKSLFYIAIFEVDKIDRIGMDAEKDGIMTAVCLKEVVDDFAAENPRYRYGCSGIDGISFGPAFGEDKTSAYKLMVAYGIYGDINRDDNDNQIILQYDISSWTKYELPLNQNNHHTSGSSSPERKYFCFTGNTTYGVQNLEYDAYTGYWFMAVYRGSKSGYPNYPLYMIDGKTKPDGDKLQLLKEGLRHEPTGIYGWNFKYGSTGLIALDDGYYYISHEASLPLGKQTSVIHLYRWDGENPFIKVD